MCDQQSLRSACASAQSDQSLCWSLKYSITVKLLTERNLEFLSLKVDCTGSSGSIHVKMPHCWKSHVTAQLSLTSRDICCVLQMEINRKKDAEISKVRKDLELLTVQYESQEASLRKKHIEAVNDLSDQVDYLSKNKNR